MTSPDPVNATDRTFRLLGADGRAYLSRTPGAWGGHRRHRIYGRLDCPSALRWLARGHYARHRVFFADEATARAAGYRPCAVCLPDAYRRWAGRGAGSAHAERGPTGEATGDRPDRAATDPPPPGSHPTTDAAGTAYSPPRTPHEQEER
ncbi:metal binding Ada-like protein [Actinomycetospora succinea]|uniref:Metal binding Ada-like protein n=1 Tax=Actinomycetospora succinea TaxID=663603 RepID=A0A4R6VHZ4_9PSEU|nr:Ada metal-binding domain-containing protein [Actinomycetospora succinea]TDQ60964.1 metal binding Ada-like protein [Actinomycetospora succinea]